MRRRGVLAAAVVAGFLVGATILLGYVGVGGFRAGWAWAVLPVAVGGAALTWFGLGRGSPRRGLWVLAVTVLGVVIGARLVDLAPPSKSRLAEMLDGLELPFFRLVSEQRLGHSSCRPGCPVVVRRYDAPTAIDSAALITVATALSTESLIGRSEARRLTSTEPRNGFTVASDRVRYEVRARPAANGHIAVTLTARARRG